MAEDKYYFEREIFSNPKHIFRFKEDVELIRNILKYKKNGKVLDLGCGEGGNSLQLAKLGFKVVCVDISNSTIRKIKTEAKKKNIPIKTTCEDIEDYDIEEEYDIIILTGVSHFLSKENIYSLIDRMKEKTKVLGINILDVFLNGSSIQKDHEGYYFKKNELKDIYYNWDILSYEEYEELNEESKVDKYVKMIIQKNKN